MANDLSDCPHIIDTAAPGLIYTGNIAIMSIRWVSPTCLAGHQAIVQRADGRVMWESVANGDDYVEKDYVKKQANGGYKVPTLTSGKLYIVVGHPDDVLLPDKTY